MRSRTLLTIVLGIVVLLSLAGCSKLRARDELNKGVRAYKGGQYETAIQHFQRSVELDPTLLNARLYLATAYAVQFVPQNPTPENQQMGEAAIREFENVLKVDPGNTTALGYIASLYFGMGGAAGATDWDKAITLFEKSKDYRRRLIQVDPRNPEHYYSIGVIDWSLTFRPRMELKTKLGLRQDEPFGPRQARERRQIAEKNSALVEEGIDVLKQALEINPKYLDAIAYLNLMYREKADIVESPAEREQYLQTADELVERHKRVREELQQVTP